MDTRIPLIIDTDPGVDDALALEILFGRPELDIRLVCSVAGNVSLDLTTANALFLTQTWGGDIPVCRGGASPLGADAASVHGEGGMGGYRLPPHSFRLDPRDAVTAAHETLAASEEPVTFITMGPLTNVAQLLREHPEDTARIRRIYAMIASKDGTGNITPYAEFNAYCDPAAAETVIRSGVEIVFAPMHLGREAKISMEELLVRADGAGQKREGRNGLQRMMEQVFAGYHDEAAGDGYVAMYDANAAEALLHPELYDFIRCTPEIDATEYPGRTFLRPDADGHCFTLEIRDPQALTATMLDDLFGPEENY